MRGLYSIVDLGTLDARGLDPVRFGLSVLAARPAALQVRDKVGGARRTLAVLRALVEPARAAGVPLFANDRADLALAAGCEGVHVGQDDLPIEVVRAIGPRLRLGLSTHNRAQVDAALELGASLDYLAVGPIFTTSSKERPDPTVGLDELRSIAGRAREARPGLPLVAIGGITMATARAVGELVDAVAVIAALLPEAPGDAAYAEVAERARAFARAVVGGAS